MPLVTVGDSPGLESRQRAQQSRIPMDSSFLSSVTSSGSPLFEHPINLTFAEQLRTYMKMDQSLKVNVKVVNIMGMVNELFQMEMFMKENSKMVKVTV